MNTNTHPKCNGLNPDGASAQGGPRETTAPAAFDQHDATAKASGFARRDFLKLVGASATAAAVFRPWQSVMAGPFTRADFEKLVPADKRLAPEWVRSLTARGEREVYRGPDLAKIGMPIGGLCAGQVYLGGDGRLWHWDIFNKHVGTGAEHYAKPLKAASPLDQGFALRVTAAGHSQERLLDAAHWQDVSFIGEYPIGYVSYADPACPVQVSLEACSPFIPLNPEDSSLPATILRFTMRNTGAQPVQAALAGWLENAVCLHSGEQRAVLRRNRLVRRDGGLALECSASEAPRGQDEPRRPDIVFDDFERGTYGDWTATGTAFGKGPVAQSEVPEYQGNLGMHGQRAVNTHSSAPASDVGARDAHTGTLTSRPFVIERNFISFLIGGGGHKGKTCVNLLIGDKPVLSTTGKSDNRMAPATWDVRKWAGQTARIQAVDNETGAWGNIGLDDIVFTDQPRPNPGPLAQEPDFGTLALALLPAGHPRPAHSSALPEHGATLLMRTQPAPADWGITDLSGSVIPAGLFAPPVAAAAAPASRHFGDKLVGALGRELALAPGAAAEIVFLVSWHFPNLKMDHLPPGRFYATKFNSALAVATYVASNFERLAGDTRLWHDTWYDSTLPYWFLDRTFLNTSILATSTCFRFGDGRFYGWEGVGCCAGTCGHVWQYAHAVSRLFPELERDTREKVDFGLALQPDGAIHFRGEFNNIPAIDAQAGTILRALREHQMTPDNAWLKRNWPGIKKATEWLIAKDGDADGLITSNQHNTLDTDWYGPVAWLSGLYLAALLAAAEMAEVTGDKAFAEKCRGIVETGRKNLVSQLYDDGYFLNKVDPKHLDAINSGTGCEIDQVMGQSWAFQVGLPRVLPEKETRAALASLWRYNFTPDVGPYRDVYKAGRWYAMPGEAGLLMCSFPRSDWDYAQAKGKGPEWAAGYFNECMNGFEYQAAGHMIWEGAPGSELVQEGLAITRAVHDRYHPSRRNPWNEVECGDHYARSMASYGVFLAACGYAYDGPKAALAFAPHLTPENFKAAFTTAEGWGTYSQRVEGRELRVEIALRWGKLRLKTLTLALPGETKPQQVKVTLGGQALPSTLGIHDDRCVIQFEPQVRLASGQTLQISLN
jgi:non-lysosomal glucosylceramidase